MYKHNLTDDNDYVYEYDAWNRLVSISTTGGSPTLVSEYRYNGLGQRIAEGDGTDTEYLIYDDRWRLISRHDGSSASLEETLYHHAGLDGYGGASDVDSVIMRRTFLSTGTPQTEDQRWYVLQNWRQDVAVMIDEAAVQRERVFFSPYGRVFGMVAGDTGFDGDYGAGDSSAITNWSTAYRAYADVDLDGTIDTTDAGYTTNAQLGWDALSRDGSTIGYAGYVQDDFIPTINHVRHRAMKTDLGRWVQRDPAGYVDGANLYEYVRSSPVGLRDPMGLASQSGGCGFGGSVGFDSCGGSGGQADPPAVAPPVVTEECRRDCILLCTNKPRFTFGPCFQGCIAGCSSGRDVCDIRCDSLYPPRLLPGMNQICKAACQTITIPPDVGPIYEPPAIEPPPGTRLDCELVAFAHFHRVCVPNYRQAMAEAGDDEVKRQKALQDLNDCAAEADRLKQECEKPRPGRPPLPPVAIAPRGGWSSE